MIGSTARRGINDWLAAHRGWMDLDTGYRHLVSNDLERRNVSYDLTEIAMVDASQVSHACQSLLCQRPSRNNQTSPAAIHLLGCTLGHD
jgi:hypothetical protein